MKIKNIKIENFRSVENITINFKENPRVLVGINESGKTNILDASKLLNPDFSPQKADVRDPSKGIIENSEVLFVFSFEEDEMEEIYQNIQQKILIDDLPKPIVKINNQRYNLKTLLNEFYKEGFYKVNVKNSQRIFTRWEFNKKIEFICNIKKPKSEANFSLKNKKDETLNISNFKLIDCDSYSKIPAELLEEATPKILDDIIDHEIIGTVSKNLPKVIYWKYDEKNLLPPSIPINNFTANLNSCIPLKNMFILANIPESEIGQQITGERQISPNSFRSLLRRVSDASTKYFRKAWPEYSNIKFSLNPNGENIDCGVEEKNIHDFRRRSDGFKRFVTVLLLLSIPAKKELLKNTLILIDEADQSLHPTGCKYLMEQLIKIAESNYVMYSTHSIFMIDKENIERHYIVEKKNEITTIKETTEETYKDEEVIYKALGTSAFEILEEKNILFEGWTDKKLFETAIKKDEKTEKFFKKIGKSHAIGVKSVKNLTQILEWSKRKIFIISDSDLIAKQEQKEFKENKGWGNWERYDEIFNTKKIVTSEDFIKKEVLKKNFLQILQKFDIEFKDNVSELPEINRLDCIKKWLINNNIIRDQLNEIIKKFKESVFKDLRLDDIEENYFNFVKILQQKIQNL